MKLADWVAIYGALVATAVAAWQGITYWQDRRPKLLVRIRTTLDLTEDGRYDLFMEAIESASAALFARVIRLELTIVNVGRGKVHLYDMTLYQTSPHLAFELNASASFPRWIEPGEAIVIVPLPEDMAGVDLTADAIVRVTTSTGQEFREEIRGFDASVARAMRSGLMDEALLGDLQAIVDAKRLHSEAGLPEGPEETSGEEGSLSAPALPEGGSR
ncbi:hypothetical protein C7C45_24110 [Micromonospora arborensis]|uniref:Uncharacterized protein n=1 Tax=Micromonospora arborensis TaxID=2116518 RepID=A0A318NEC5_9ACTN|nr:hypothetical protein [Micromonospora arborensis]PYC66587.1 hypothetical protein C7C45_24110 [Micromonospora arborensis]